MSELICILIVAAVGGRLLYVRRAERASDRWSVGFGIAVVVVMVAVLAAGCLPRVNRAVDDGGLTTRVKTALLNDPAVPGAAVTVTTNGGVVTLTGRVRTTAERERVIAITRQTAGVVEVQAEALAVDAP